MITKTDLVNVVAEQDVTKKAAGNIVNAVFQLMYDKLVEGEEVRINGFGTFKLAERAARKGRNPATGDAIEIPARKVVTFKPTKALKDAVR